MAAAPGSPRRAAALALALACLAAAGLPAAADDWKLGRATFYGLDGWSIHKGSCGLGYQYKSLSTGWDVAAVADASPEFPGSCGRCYEVQCDPRAQVFDGYGNKFDRSGVCRAGQSTVVVRTVDACGCNYPGNPYSNKRWCCGDHTDTQGAHFDLSIWAFEKLGDTNQGVIGIKWRRVACDYRPASPAPAGSTPMPPSEQPAALGYPGDAYSPGGVDVLAEPLVVRFDSAGQEQGAVRKKVAGDTSATVVTRGELLSERGGGSVATASASASGSTSASASASASSGDSSSDNGCTDKAPSGSTCAQQKSWGACSQPWMISGLFCRATCGRCQMSGSASSPSPSSSSSGGCSDVTPPGSASCQQQKSWGACDQGWMKDGQFCSKTCGRCSSSSGFGSSSPSPSPSPSRSSGC